MAAHTVNELLCFVAAQYNQVPRDILTATINEFYDVEDTVNAKKVVIAASKRIDISDAISKSTKPRKNTKGESEVEQRTVVDILDIWDVVDAEKGGIFDTQFVAADVNKIPSVNAEKYTLKFLVSTIQKIRREQEKQVQQSCLGLVSATVETNSHLISSIHHKLSLNSSLLSSSRSPRKLPPRPDKEQRE